MIKRNITKKVKVGTVVIGSGAPIVVQTMAATKTRDIDRTVAQIEMLRKAGAGIVRVAVDNDQDAQALKEIRKETHANLSVDLQENYLVAEKVAPYADKIRYNPGHLYHLEREKTVLEKVAWLVALAKEHGCAIRIGVNCGSVAPDFKARYPHQMEALVQSTLYHAQLMEDLRFENFCVSLKDSDPNRVVEANIKFAQARPDVPLHLGVTEAGLPPDGILKTRRAFEKLLPQGLGDTIRVSLTLPYERKYEEVEAGLKILKDIEEGRFISPPAFKEGLNIISCPSCSRVENERFVEFAQKVKEITSYAKNNKLTIAVMGCRVNGPGETDDADLGLWCGPTSVHLKKKSQELGVFAYDKILPRLKIELDKII